MTDLRRMDALQETRERPERFNPCLLDSLRFLSSCASFVVLVIGTAVLVGWITRADTLIRPEYRSLVMRPNSALAFILCTLCLWIGRPGKGGVRRMITFGFSAIVFVVSAITVIENLFDLYLPTDRLLISMPSSEASESDPWRMALVTGLGLMFIALALFTTMREKESGATTAQFLAGLTFLAALLGLMDEILNPEVSQLHMPLATMLCLGLMATAIFLWRPDEGVMKIVAADGLGGAMARRLVPAAIIVSILIAWVRWQGQSRGYYDPELGAGMGVAIQVVLFAWLILANANYLEKADQLRKRAEEVARHEHEKMQQRTAAEIVQLVAKTKELEKQLGDSRATSS